MNVLKKLSFDGKEYSFFGGYFSKREAQVVARDLRRKGRKARVVGNSKIGYFVYKR